MSERNADPSKTVKIKKYANRRLYNTATSSYVTLEDLAQMVKDDIDFAVYDAKTGDDITQPVLTQIILEEEGKDGQSLLPVNFLRQLIRLYGHTMQGFVPSYLEQSMEMLINQQEKLYKTFGTNPTVANLQAVTQSNVQMFQKAMDMFSPFGATAPKEAPETEQTPSRQDPDITDLQSQLSMLHKKLDDLAKKKT